MNLLSYLLLYYHIVLVYSDTYSVRVGTQDHVNEVADNFLSFSIDPNYLFSTNEKSKECMCMAGSLSPAYIRIAGPTTASLNFINSSIVIDDVHHKKDQVKVPMEKWLKFASWAKSSGYRLVFALNPTHKSAAGLWDANSALSILSSADRHQLDNIVWELGYECKNQSIEEYLNDLQTLKVIVETFPRGLDQGWEVVAGDVTNCLQTESKSDFKDYITLSNDLMDAVLLNGNTSAQELEKMSESDRMRLLTQLSTSKTPLWLTEKSVLEMNEMERAVDWLISLGFSARNGFNVHFRELREDELYEPTLSFYMALLYKNLVGERVLNVDIDEAGHASLFAHCTSLRHKPVAGAVTLYGANVDDQAARFSVKLSRTEDGGDIMQFIVGREDNGTIMVNGRAMYHEGDIRPVVKRVRPYKTLLINLPPKSFGFWVLANTNIEACHDIETNDIGGKKFVEAIPVTDLHEKVFKDKGKRSGRSIIKGKSYDVTDYSEEASFDGEIDISTPEVDEEISQDSKEELITLVNNISKNFKYAFPEFVEKLHKKRNARRIKREINEPKAKGLFHLIDKEFKKLAERTYSEKLPRHIAKSEIVDKIHNTRFNKTGLLDRLVQRNSIIEDIKNQRISRLRKRNLVKNKLAKRNAVKQHVNIYKTKESKRRDSEEYEIKNRTRRNIITATDLDEIDSHNKHKLYKILKTLEQTIQDVPVEIDLVQKDNSIEDNTTRVETVDTKELKDENESGVDMKESKVDLKESKADSKELIRKEESEDKSVQNGLMITILDSASSLLVELREKMDKVWELMNSMEM